jgi:hypothetical protein
MGTKDVLPKHIVDAHMYDAIYASMEHSLQEAQIREAKYQKGEVIRKKEERLRGMVKLPVGEFYANTRFDHGRGGAEGVMRRRVADFHDDEHVCSAKVCCNGAPAIIRCMSCAKLDPRRRGHYCQACFDRRHPPHRAKHAWMPIEKSEHLGRQLQHRNKVAEIEVFGDDVERLRRKVREQQEDAAEIGDPKRTVHLIRDADAKSQAVKVRVARLRRALRAPALRPASESAVVTKGLLALYKSKQSMEPRETQEREETQLMLPPLTPEAPKQRDRGFSQLAMWEVLPEHAAASLFANAFRKKKARERMYEAVQKRYMKVYDANTGYFYFVDTQTRVVAWEPPAVMWKDERFKLSSRRHGDPVMTKRQAMARAASKILTPRSWGKKYAPRSNLDAMAEGDEEEESTDEEEEEKWTRIPEDHEVFDPTGEYEVTRGRVTNEGPGHGPPRRV